MDAANDRGELHAVRSAEHAAVIYPVLVDGGHTRRGYCMLEAYVKRKKKSY